MTNNVENKVQDNVVFYDHNVLEEVFVKNMLGSDSINKIIVLNKKVLFIYVDNDDKKYTYDKNLDVEQDHDIINEVLTLIKDSGSFIEEVEGCLYFNKKLRDRSNKNSYKGISLYKRVVAKGKIKDKLDELGRKIAVDEGQPIKDESDNDTEYWWQKY